MKNYCSSDRSIIEKPEGVNLPPKMIFYLERGTWPNNRKIKTIKIIKFNGNLLK